MRVLVLLGTVVLYGMERAVIETFDAMRPEVEGHFLMSRRGAQRNVPLYREVAERGLSHSLLSDYWDWPMLGRPRTVQHALRMMVALILGNIDALWTSRRSDAIYVPNPIFLLYSLGACTLFRLLRRRVVFEFHNVPDSAGRLRVVLRLFHPLVSDFVCGSDYAVRYVRAEAPYIDPGKLHLIRRTVARPSPITTSPLERLPAGQDIVFIGQVMTRKGVEVLIDAFSLTASEFPQARLSLVGGIDPSIERRLREKVAASTYGDRIIFWDFRSDAREVLAGAYVAVQPSLPEFRETAPRATMEAMAAGIPSIVFRSGALAENVSDGVTGIVCREPTATCLAEALRAMLSERELRDRMGAAARERYEARHSPERITEEWKDLFARSAALPYEPAHAG